MLLISILESVATLFSEDSDLSPRRGWTSPLTEVKVVEVPPPKPPPHPSRFCNNGAKAPYIDR
jgi:hypothetical protein